MNRLHMCVAACAATMALGATSASARTIPMKARDAGAATVVGGAAPVIQTHDTGSGIATHLGHFTLDASESVNVDTGEITDGSFTFTGAHGDTISGTYSGNALPGLTGYLVSGPVTGGTGRFAGATGCLSWIGALDPGDFTFTDEITGTIFVSEPHSQEHVSATHTDGKKDTCSRAA